MDNNQPTPAPVIEESSGPFIPLWIALAGLAVAVILALLIALTVLQPLLSLVFPTNPEPPLPSDAALLEEVPNPRLSYSESLYGSAMGGCDMVNFYMQEGGTCVIAPFSCSGNPTDGYVNRYAGTVTSIATCTGKQKDLLNSFSWEVYISSGYLDEYETRFRLYLYRER